MRIPAPGIALLALLISAGCQRRAEPDAAPDSPVLRISQRNEPDELDPALASLPDDFFIIRALSEGLVSPAMHGGDPVPAAAEHWEVSADGRVWRFHLRPGAQWSNGEPVAAADFVASYRRALAPATAGPRADLFFAVANAQAYASGRLSDFSQVGFRAAAPDELVVTLERPVARFLDYAATGPWIPVNAGTVAEFGREWTQPGRYVGNGPFVLAEWRPNQRIVVRKNPRYHGAAQVRLGEIQFLRFDDENAEEHAYRANEVDVTMALPTSKLELYARERPAELHQAPLAETRYLAFNTRRPPLNDVRVRRALALAIDRRRLALDVVRGGRRPADRLVPPEMRPAGEPALPSGFAGGLSGPAAYDEARQLLAAAGFPAGSHFPRLELAGWSNNPVLDAIQEMWKKNLGIEVAIVNRDARAHLAVARAGGYDIAFLPLIPQVPDPLPLLGGFATGAPDNYPQWSDPRFDALVAAARTAAPGRAGPLLRAAEERLLDQCPATPLYYNAQNWAMRTAVHGWQQDGFWNRSYLGLSLDAATPP
jgi:oligopeptide transport system substrate-binding protein